jgi:hypothetical protein
MKRISWVIIVAVLSWMALLVFGCSTDGGYAYDYGTDQPSDSPVTPDNPYDPAYEAPEYEAVDTWGMDRDGDGYAPADGDCDDSLPQVNPGAYDHPDNGIDDDCDGTVDNPPVDCDCGSDDLVAGLDLCDRRYLLFSGRVFTTPRGESQGAGVRTGYGNPGNGLSVRKGCGYTILATGPVDLALCDDNRQIGTDFYGDPLWSPCPGTEPDPNPNGRLDDAPICDTQQLFLQLKAPINANGFSFDFVYMSAEYPEWVDEGFNDTFYAILEDPATGTKQNISFDNFSHEIEIDNAFFEDPPVTSLAGTGYDLTCINEVGPMTSVCGSSTGWLRTSWNIDPGKEFNLTFSIHDEGDGIYDSAVIIDNFQWSPVPVEPGTVPII